MKSLFLLPHDQLMLNHPLFEILNKEKDKVVLIEFLENYIEPKHHKKKVAFLISALRHFVLELKNEGFSVDHRPLFEKNTPESLNDFLLNLENIELYTSLPSCFSQYRALMEWKQKKGNVLHLLPDPKFLSTVEDFASYAKGKKSLRMEFFYRLMRKKHGILMQGEDPEGGKWNYDQENRAPPKKGLKTPAPYSKPPDSLTQEVLALVKKHFSDHFGDLEPFYFATTRQEALKALQSFINERLPSFGTYQDAMQENNVWMFHSHISFYLNIGMLHPLEVIQKVERAYKEQKVPLNAAEGFIRQVMGWREFVRGIYWIKMPGYSQENFLNASRPLPEFFWTAKTSMNCLKQCIQDTQKYAYAHHIQRLMVLGNFCLLAGIHPNEVNEWYHVVYADAFEWVEMPNVSGMILFADGGYLASKPYAASGAYIHKMSDYCVGCSYQVKEKNGEKACPFNYLYWYFLMKHRKELGKNPRLSMIYRSLDKMSLEKKNLIQKDSLAFFSTL